MKAPFNPIDPRLQILADEAADLPVKAAGEARVTMFHRRKRRRHFAMTITVLFISLCVWRFLPRVKAGRESIAIQSPSDAPVTVPAPELQPLPHAPHPSTPRSSEPHKVAIVRTEEQARMEPLPLPEGLTKEQESVVEAARGLPLLLVRDNTGRVVRIHAIDR